VTIRATLTVLVVFACCFAPVNADFSRGANYSGAASPDRFQQRQTYLDAVHLIRTNQYSRFNKLKPQLRTYSLYPYLVYTEMSYRISRQTEQDILEFVEQNQDTPLTEPLLQHWFANLAKRGEWDLLVKHVDKVTPSKAVACHHGYALYKTGQHDLAMARAQELWQVGFSQPDECDSLFKIWRDNGGLTSEQAWQRFAMSVKGNETKLSSYLMRFLDRKDKSFASNYRLVHAKPHTVKRTRAFRKQNIRNREIILHGVRRLARSQPEDALTTLGRYQLGLCTAQRL